MFIEKPYPLSPKEEFKNACIGCVVLVTCPITLPIIGISMLTQKIWSYLKSIIISDKVKEIEDKLDYDFKWKDKNILLGWSHENIETGLEKTKYIMIDYSEASEYNIINQIEKQWLGFGTRYVIIIADSCNLNLEDINLCEGQKDRIVIYNISKKEKEVMIENYNVRLLDGYYGPIGKYINVNYNRI
jgi:hypothetical protein